MFNRSSPFVCSDGPIACVKGPGHKQLKHTPAFAFFSRFHFNSHNISDALGNG